MNIGNFLKHNWFAIFYFNFKMLPFKQAIFLPFDFYNSIRFKCLSGKVFLSTNKIKTGMIKIGAQGSEMFPTSCFIMDIKGNLFFGGKSSIGCGGLIKIGKSGKIIIAGSSSVTPLMEKLKESYEKINPNVEIEIQQSDSTTGVNSVVEGIADIGMASREIKESELKKGINTQVLAIDGLAVIVNKENPISNLKKEDVRKIFLGEITSWEQVK